MDPAAPHKAAGATLGEEGMVVAAGGISGVGEKFS